MARPLLAVVLLASCWQVEIGGLSIGRVVGPLVWSPAEAHEARRSRGLEGRRRMGFQGPLLQPVLPPAFPPLPQPPAFRPLPLVKGLPPLPQGPAFQPSLPRQPAHLPEMRAPSALPAPALPGSGRVASRADPGVRLDQRDIDRAGGWKALVRPAAGTPIGMPPSPPSKARPVGPAPTGADAMRTHGKAYRHLMERVASRPPEAPAPGAPGTKQREISDKGHGRGPEKGIQSKGADKGTAKGVANARPLPRRLGGRWIGELLPPVGSFKPHEVVAINLSAEGIAEARAKSFEVIGQTELPGLGLTLTHLTPPATMNAVSARDQLFELVPDGGFVLNRVYSPYRLGAGHQGGGSGSMPAQQDAGACPSERCFGSALIKWQPALAACAHDVKVGIIDTGFDKGHPALAGVRHELEEFVPDGSIKASNQHGTGVLSLLAGRADSGIPGLIPDASFSIASAFFDDAAGQPISDTTQMVRALDWLKRRGVTVVNLSFAGPADDLVHHAVRELTKAGTVVVAAAGNDGPGAPPSYPAAYPEVIAVTAVDRNLAAYRYASRGGHIDLAAPGVDVWTAMPGRREGAQTGTSFAVPYVTAVVAVALAGTSLPADGDGLTPKRHALAQLERNIRSLGSQGRDPIFGGGLVQAPASCGPALATVATRKAPQAEAQADPWAGTVMRVRDNGTADAMVVGATVGGSIGAWSSPVTSSLRPVSAPLSAEGSTH